MKINVEPLASLTYGVDDSLDVGPPTNPNADDVITISSMNSCRHPIEPGHNDVTLCGILVPVVVSVNVVGMVRLILDIPRSNQIRKRTKGIISRKHTYRMYGFVANGVTMVRM